MSLCHGGKGKRMNAIETMTGSILFLLSLRNPLGYSNGHKNSFIWGRVLGRVCSRGRDWFQLRSEHGGSIYEEVDHIR